MIVKIEHTDTILLVGDGDLPASVAVCLLNAGHRVEVCTSDVSVFRGLFEKYSLSQKTNTEINYKDCININSDFIKSADYKLAIIISTEILDDKIRLIKQVASFINKETPVCINSEIFDLADLQKNIINPDRLLGLNWTQPAHTTLFLEIISTENNYSLAKSILSLAKKSWCKDPYISKNTGIRSRLVSAMAREACFLVDNGYASVEDIDRACRNDAGYYLPFSGNCRYMDLMGTYAYGMVMKDLNSDLSKDTELPDFLLEIMREGGLGMENNRGFYDYTDEEVKNWKTTMEKFSYQIQSIIEKYPFNYNK